MLGLAHALRLFVEAYGLAALFLLLVVEEMGIWLPLPGDLVIMYFGCRLAHSSHPQLSALSVLLTVTAAVVCGSLVLYGFTGRFRGAIHRHGRLIHLNEQRLCRMERAIQRHGALLIVPGRLVPGLRIPTTIVAGVCNVPVRQFLPFVSIAALIWGAVYLVLGYAGAHLLREAGQLSPDDPLSWVFWASVALLVLVLVFHRPLQAKLRQR